MDSNAKFIRFSGVLLEDMEFVRDPGWEAFRIMRRPDEDPDSRYRIDLLDEENRVITTAHPSVTLVPACGAGQRGPRAASIIAYLPLVEHAREVVLRSGDREVYRETIAIRPPKIRITSCKMRKGDKVKIRWEARSQDETKSLSYVVVYIPDADTAFTIAAQQSDPELVVDLSTYPGSNGARFAVLATDGLRSSYAVSEPFEVAEHKPTVAIHEPLDGCSLPALQPVSFRGIAIEPGGKRIEDAHLSWSLDGKPLVQGRALIVVPDVTPGKHVVRLECKSPQSGLTDSCKCSFEVAEPNEEQRRWVELLHRRVLGPSEADPRQQSSPSALTRATPA